MVEPRPVSTAAKAATLVLLGWIVGGPIFETRIHEVRRGTHRREFLAEWRLPYSPARGRDTRQPTAQGYSESTYQCQEAGPESEEGSELLAYKQQQWEVFAKQMKSNFLKQEQQFQADIDKLREELATAQANGREAAALMQRLASGQVDMEEEVVELPESSRESLLSAGPPAAEGFLQDDLRAASQVRLGARMPAPPQETAPMMSGLPAEGGPTAPTTTVPGPTSLNAAYVTQEPNAETGPYQASPSAHVRRVTTSPRPPRTGTSPKVPREPIKRLLKPCRTRSLPR